MRSRPAFAGVGCRSSRNANHCGPQIVSSALFAQLEALDWLLRDRETRVVRLTEFGAHKIHETFGSDSRARTDSRVAKEWAVARRAE
jgi:hypothetical protein